MVKAEKQFDTGLRILEILKILLNGNLSKNNLINKLNMNSDIEQVYTFEAFIKYFNTVELMGLKLNREKNIYKLENALTYLNLNAKEKELYLKLLSNVKYLYDERRENAVKSLTYRTLKYFNNEISQSTVDGIFENRQTGSGAEKQRCITETINKFINDKLMVKIDYGRKNGAITSITVEIRKAEQINGKMVLTCYSPEKRRNKKIFLDSVVSFSQLPDKVSEAKIMNTIVFEVYGRLAYLYKLKPSEKVINFSDSHLIISNSEEDKDSLLRRLLKYGENCKVIKPAEVREEFISLTGEILKNLGENND